MLNLNRVKSIVDRYEYISFDIFDTLLNRDVPRYIDVFSIVQKLSRQRFSMNYNFCDERIAAESRARIEKKEKEVTLQDIYKQFRCNDDDKNKLLNLELEVEAGLLSCNLEIKSLYQYCIDTDKKIVIISDMYLSKTFLETVLHKNGYHGYSDIFVSSEIGLKKRDGKLFRFVLRTLQIEGNQLLHIGDSIRSDYIMPKLIGIKAFHVQRFKPRNVGEAAYIETFIHNHVAKYTGNRYGKLGYSAYGPLLYGFTKYIIERSTTENVDKVLFASRDSYIVEKSYKELLNKNKEEINSSYFYVSRRSLQVPLLSVLKDPFKQIFQYASFSPFSTTKEVLRRLGFDGGDSKIRSIDDIISIIQSDDYLDVRTGIIKNSNTEAACFFRYLNEIGFGKNKRILFIDIGWKCSSQIAIEVLIKNRYTDINLKGIYLGVHPESLISKDKVEGYLFYRNNNEDFFLATMGGMSVLEIFFTAPHGTVARYSECGCDFEKYEYEDENHFKKEVDYYRESQSAALSFVEDLVKSPISQVCSFDNNCCFSNLRRIMVNPTLEETIAIGGLRFDGANGINPIIDWKGYKYYLLHPKKLVVDYGQSGWKVGFLKRALRFKWLPYTMFKLSYKWYKRKQA